MLWSIIKKSLQPIHTLKKKKSTDIDEDDQTNL